MSTNAILVKTLKSKVISYQLPSIAIICLLLTACLGSSDVPVTYMLPEEGKTYTSAEFLPVIEFPNGAPSQSEVVIQLNGVEIQDAFDEWGTTLLRVTDTDLVSNPAYATLIGSLRDGQNIFQVVEPNKQAIVFNALVDGADIRITQFEDNWEGNGPKGSSNNMTISGYIADVGALNYLSVLVEGIDTDGNRVELLDGSLPLTGSHMELWLNEENIPSRTFYTAVDGIYAMSVFGQNHITADPLELADRPYGFSMYLPDSDEVDLVTITIGEDIAGTTVYSNKTWLRSDVNAHDARINNRGGLSIAADQITVNAFLPIITSALNDPDPNDPDDPTLPRNFLGPNECAPAGVNELGGLIQVSELRLLNTDIAAGIDEDRVNNNESTLNIQVETDVIIDGQIGIDLGLFTLGCEFRSTVNRGRGKLGLDLNLGLTTDNDGDVASNISSLNISNVDAIMDSGLCGTVGNIVVGIFAGIVENAVNNIISTIVNLDLAKTRLVLRRGEEFSPPVPTECAASQCREGECIPANPYIPGEYLWGTFLLELKPAIATFFNRADDGVTNPTENDMRWGLNLGFHIHGSGTNRIPSIGTPFVPGKTNRADRTVDCATFGAPCGPSTQSTTGIILSEMFINQLFMGLWESGILYIDLDLLEIEQGTSFIDDFKVAFASHSPWEVELQPDNSLEGELIIKVPDLRVEISADIYAPILNLPDGGNDFLLFYSIVDANIALNLGPTPVGHPDEGGMRISLASAIEAQVQNTYSDIPFIQGLNADALINSALLSAFTTLGNEFEVDIPLPLLASFGIDIEINDVRSDGDELHLFVDLTEN